MRRRLNNGSGDSGLGGAAASGIASANDRLDVSVIATGEDGPSRCSGVAGPVCGNTIRSQPPIRRRRGPRPSTGPIERADRGVSRCTLTDCSNYVSGGSSNDSPNPSPLLNAPATAARAPLPRERLLDPRALGIGAAQPPARDCTGGAGIVGEGARRRSGDDAGGRAVPTERPSHGAAGGAHDDHMVLVRRPEPAAAAHADDTPAKRRRLRGKQSAGSAITHTASTSPAQGAASSESGGPRYGCCSDVVHTREARPPLGDAMVGLGAGELVTAERRRRSRWDQEAPYLDTGRRRDAAATPANLVTSGSGSPQIAAAGGLGALGAESNSSGSSLSGGPSRLSTDTFTLERPLFPHNRDGHGLHARHGIASAAWLVRGGRPPDAPS